MRNITFFLLLFTGILSAQIVNIPDANFKAKLVNSNCITSDTDWVGDLPVDTNGDGEIQVTEALAAPNLIIDNANINDLTGIEAFSNITVLVCHHNQLTSLDVTGLSALQILNCEFNPITSLNFSGLTALYLVLCSSTLITTLDFTTNPNLSGFDANDCTLLTSINASGTQLGGFNMNNTTNIQHLNLHGCTGVSGQALQWYLSAMSNIQTLDLAGVPGMTSLYYTGSTLDITGCTSLQILLVRGPAAGTIDVSSFVNLTDLELTGGNRTSLNLAGLNNLTYLNCDDNQLTSLDLSAQTNLRQLWISNNDFATVDLSAVPQLEQFFCSNNTLTAIDFSNNSNMKVLDVSNNPIANINVSNMNLLEHLYVSGTTMNAVNISNNPLLRGLSIRNTGIAAINLSNNPLLFDFNFENTPIPAMDLSSFTQLTQVTFGSDSLIELNIKNGKNEIVTFTSSPNLAFVCADESQIANVQSLVDASTVVSSYCSFVPGGNYNTVKGVVKWDQDNDGCDVADTNFPYNVLMQLSNGTNTSGTFLNANGNYTLYAETGTYILTPQIEQPAYFNLSPSSASIDFPSLNNSTATQNFCITANGSHPDLEVVLLPLRNARPGFDIPYKIIYKNKGNQLASGTIDFTFDDTRIDFVSANPNTDSTSPNHLVWNFSNLLPFETRSLDLTLNVNSPVEDPAVNAGDVLHFECNIDVLAGDQTPLDNTSSLDQIVTNAQDPNDKTCLEGNTISDNEIGKYVHYNINFENVGSAEATNIVVKDLIDTNKFEMDSIVLLYASHPVETKIRGNQIEFVFEGINLPPSSVEPIGGHGNVLFKIKTKPTLMVGDHLSNTANIFFDYNAPIQTNEARTNITNLSNDGFLKDLSIHIAPNPVRNNITITSENAIKSIQLFDAQGRVLQTTIENELRVNLNIAEKTSGVYFLKITTEKGSSVQKIIKE